MIGLYGENMPKAYDLKSLKNEYWEVLVRIGTKGNYATWKCKCKCGNEKILTSKDIKRLKTCSECTYEDKTTKRFGNFTVISYEGTHKTGGSQWLCKCDCGNIKIVKGGSLANGTIKSCGCIQAVSLEKRGLTLTFHQYKHSAISRNKEFTLTLEEFEYLIKENCHYCGLKPYGKIKIRQSKKFKEKIFTCNGIDRVDNSKGYTVVNCVTCCKLCNFSKHDMTTDEFYNHIRRIVSHNSLI
jgi:hypothetical protein